MKKLAYLLSVLAVAFVVVGCKPAEDTTVPPADTNAVPAAPDTNAPAPAK